MITEGTKRLLFTNMATFSRSAFSWVQNFQNVLFVCLSSVKDVVKWFTMNHFVGSQSSSHNMLPPPLERDGLTDQFKQMYFW